MHSWMDVLFLTSILSYILCGSLYNLWVFLQKLADTPQYPLTIHAFQVTTSEGKARVDAFYEWLEVEEEKGENTEDDGKEALAPKRETEHDMIDLTQSQLLNLLNYLYNQPRMWERLESGKQLSVPVQEWINRLNNAAVTYFAQQTEHFCTATELPFISIQFFHDLIQYSKVYTNPAFAMGRSKFLATVLRACTVMCDHDGMLPALLLLAHLRPDLVSDDAYPVLNTNTPYYKEWIEPNDLTSYPAFKKLLDEYDSFVIL